jgi:hypothetical protein
LPGFAGRRGTLDLKPITLGLPQTQSTSIDLSYGGHTHYATTKVGKIHADCVCCFGKQTRFREAGNRVHFEHIDAIIGRYPKINATESAATQNFERTP